MFESLPAGVQAAFKTLQSQGELTESNLQDGLQLIAAALIAGGVSGSVSQAIMDQVTQKVRGRRILFAPKPYEELVKIVSEQLAKNGGLADSAYPILAEEAQHACPERNHEDLAICAEADQFTLEHFKELLEKMAKPGLFQKFILLMPGMGDLRKMITERGVNREIQLMIGLLRSMTPAERQNPKLIDASRHHRISRGAGVDPDMITQLMTLFSRMIPAMQMMGTIKADGDKNAMMRRLQQSLQLDLRRDPWWKR